MPRTLCIIMAVLIAPFAIFDSYGNKAETRAFLDRERL